MVGGSWSARWEPMQTQGGHAWHSANHCTTVVVLTSVIVPFTVPLKTALAIVHCPSVSWSARTSAHCILWRKYTQKHKHDDDDEQSMSKSCWLTCRSCSTTIVYWVILTEWGRLSVCYNTKHPMSVTSYTFGVQSVCQVCYCAQKGEEMSAPPAAKAWVTTQTSARTDVTLCIL